jgi:ribonucleotide monophosphatase NagD (HAD superfamily)
LVSLQTSPDVADLQPDFGLVFDIDGVIVRGGKVLPHSADAFRLLIDEKTGKFWVPTIFVTNAGNCLRQKKADQLSNWLPGVTVWLANCQNSLLKFSNHPTSTAWIESNSIFDQF